MLNTKLFEFADFHCANDYIMAREERTSDDCLTYIKSNKLRVEDLIFKPKTNQLRFKFLPCTANNQMTEVFNVSKPSASFLRQLWNLNLSSLQRAMTEYMVQSDFKSTYDALEEDDKTWVSSIILGDNS